MRRAAFVLLPAALASCTPISKRTTIHDDVLTTREEIGKPSGPAVRGTVLASARGLEIQLDASVTCPKERVKTVRRRKDTVRSANGFLLFGEYFLGITGAAAGTLLFLDNKDKQPGDDRTFDFIGMEPDAATTTSYIAGGVGGAFLLLAIIDSIRAGDSSQSLGTVTVRESTGSFVPCGKGTGQDIALGVVATLSGAKKAAYFPLGESGPGGRLSVPWSALPKDVGTARWPALATIVYGAPGAIQGELKKGRLDQTRVIGEVDLVSQRASALTGAWAEAKAAGTAEAIRQYRERFPRENEAEAQKLYQELRSGELLAALAAALNRRDASAARLALDEWKIVDPAHPLLAQREKEVVALEGGGGAVVLLERLAGEIAAAERPDASAAQFQAAARTIAELGALGARDDKVIGFETRLTAARRQRAIRLATEASLKLKEKDPAGALRQIEEAYALDPAQPMVQSVRTEVLALEVKRLIKVAKQQVKSGDVLGAQATLGQAERLAPGDRALLQVRADVDKKAAAARAREDKVAAAAAKKAAAAEAREAAKAEREAKREEARREREEAKAEREEAARAKAEARRIEKEAAAEARARAKAEAEARKLALKQTEQQRKDAAAAAEAKRRAELQAAEDKKKADAAAAEVAAAEAAKRERGRPQTIELRLDGRFASENVLGKTPVPAGCKGTIFEFWGKPGDCKPGQTCAPRLMHQSDVTCSDHKISFIKDGPIVWGTCSQRTCNECLERVKQVLSRTLAADPKTKKPGGIVVTSCPKVTP